MLLQKIYYSYKNTLIGTIAGGAAGYYLSKKYIKGNKTWMLVAGVIAGATLGSLVDYKVRAKIATAKNKSIITQ